MSLLFPSRRWTFCGVCAVTGLLLLAASSFAAQKEFTPEQRNHWAFRQVVEPAVPKTAASWGQNKIDKFILHPLEAKRIQPSAPADKITLLRRATFDLTGLPPTPDDINAFLADNSPQAFER